jgi:histidyl-tRNA synthetase
MRFKAPRGTEDALPDQTHRWQRVEAVFRERCRLFGYAELRTPTFEETELFVRSSGETSDVVSKQMYSFKDKGGRDITLKPEGTAPAMRALIEHGLLQPGTVRRVSYVTPVFRYERPQMGRLREHHQVGIELVGSASPNADAEVIEFTVGFFEALGLTGVSVLLNSLGRSVCRAAYKEALLRFAGPALDALGEEARAKARQNPLRLLDSKDEAVIERMRDAPIVLDFLEPEARARFETLQSLLKSAGIDFQVKPSIVRGLDYYTETVFEVQSGSLGSQNALCGGGRYDDLIGELGGPSMPSVGVAMGIERALIVLAASGIDWERTGLGAFVAVAEPSLASHAQSLVRTLRREGVSCTYDLDCRSLKSQLGQADRASARWAVILGPDEWAQGACTLRDMATGGQSLVSLHDLAGALKERQV